MTATRKPPPMTLPTTGTAMTSDQTPRTARQAPSRQHRPEASRLPGQLLDRDITTTALIPAGSAAEDDLRRGHRLRPRVPGRAGRLCVTAPGAIARACQPPASPRRQAWSAAGRAAGREAGR